MPFTELKTCWRCGVDFDPSPYIEGAPCPDCQLDDAPLEWLPLRDTMALYNERRDRLVTYFYKRRYSDVEIGAAIGMDATGVARVRRRLGFPAHKFTGDEKWRDPDKVRRESSQRMLGNKRNRFGQVTA